MVRITVSHSSSETSRMGLWGRMATLLTSTSIFPSAPMPSSTMSRTLCGSVTSPRTVCVLAPNSRHWAATDSSSGRLARVFRTKSAPSRAKVRATSRAMLRLAPVIMAVFPCKRIGSLLMAVVGVVKWALVYSGLAKPIFAAAARVRSNVLIWTIPRLWQLARWQRSRACRLGCCSWSCLASLTSPSSRGHTATLKMETRDIAACSSSILPGGRYACNNSAGPPQT